MKDSDLTEDEKRRRAITAWWGRKALDDFIANKRIARAQEEERK